MFPSWQRFLFPLQKHEDTECPCVVVSCPHKCSVQTLLRSEVRAWPGPLRSWEPLGPRSPLKLRPELPTDGGSDG